MFRDNDVICFLGDSITAGGLWMSEVYQELRQKYKVRCYNCGVSGGAASKAVNYLHANCLIYNPDYVVIMFGINDCASWYLSKSHAHFEDKYEQLDRFFELHKENYERIIKECTERGVKAIICIPVPYDEVTVSDTENLKCQYLLERIGDFQRDIAKKYDCFVVDFSTPMKEMLGKRDIIKQDRVHPTVLGYHTMAQIFLRDTGYISELNLDTPFEFDDWNLERYNIEQKLHKVHYVEFCDLLSEGWLKGLSSEEKKKIARKKYDDLEVKQGFVAEAYLNYIDTIDDRPRIIGEIVRLTI